MFEAVFGGGVTLSVTQPKALRNALKHFHSDGCSLARS